MTRPYLVALGTMPRALFAGIFILGKSHLACNPSALLTSITRKQSAGCRLTTTRSQRVRLPSSRIAMPARSRPKTRSSEARLRSSWASSGSSLQCRLPFPTRLVSLNCLLLNVCAHLMLIHLATFSCHWFPHHHHCADSVPLVRHAQVVQR